MAYATSKKKTFDLDLWRRYRDALDAGDKTLTVRLRNQIVEENKALVFRFANRAWKASSMPVDLDDLAQAGMIGIAKALPGFDPAKGRFSTYAVHYIRKEILTAIEECMAVKRPVASSMPYKLWRKGEAFYAQHGRDATPADLGVDEKTAAKWSGKLALIPLEGSGGGIYKRQRLSGDRERNTLAEIIDDDRPTALDIMVEADRENEAMLLLSKLAGVDREIMWETVIKGRSDADVARSLRQGAYPGRCDAEFVAQRKAALLADMRAAMVASEDA